jgi:transposase-like protein
MGYKTYEEVFKKKAVEMMERGESIGEISEKLKVSSNTLTTWRRKYGVLDKIKTKEPGAINTQTQDIIRNLERKLDEKENQIKILKQAFSILMPRDVDDI